jgi:hypothetical protein
MARASAINLLAAGVASLGVMMWGQESKPTGEFRSQRATINPVTPLSAASFSNPPSADRPWVRLNMPSTADPNEIRAEVQDLYDKGIAGVEVGQGAFPNNAQLVALLSKANELGIKVSLSHGPTQNPSGYSIDDDDARKTLAFGEAGVSAGATFEGSLPPAHPPALPQFGPQPSVDSSEHPRTTLIALLAYRCIKSPCAAAGPAELDPSSVIDLTLPVTAKNAGGYKEVRLQATYSGQPLPLQLAPNGS